MFEAIVITIMIIFGVWLIVSVVQGNNRSNRYLTLHAKEERGEPLTDEERAFMASEVERFYNAGKITFMQYDLLKAKYTGEESMTSRIGIDKMMELEKKRRR